ncbi:hypothetical protein [Sporisorium scitamineum]|uniref:N-acetyltransferase domain-containing protein n=1 Tax=Sporisorium scitamineum TaxID=49012 RepID=A0A0F7S614_9BASI|nr:hypothetical protein [Sporisorium scitamineum]
MSASTSPTSGQVSSAPLIDTSSITLSPYTGEHQMHAIINLIEKELSEPYIVYTYRYFVNQWPSLCFLAYTPTHEAEYRGKGLAKRLVKRALEEMVGMGAQEVVLETEADNVAALALYERLGFIREKRLHRFYLNGKSSFRLVLPIPEKMQRPIPPELDAPPPIGLNPTCSAGSTPPSQASEEAGATSDSSPSTPVSVPASTPPNNSHSCTYLSQ